MAVTFEICTVEDRIHKATIWIIFDLPVKSCLQMFFDLPVYAFFFASTSLRDLVDQISWKSRLFVPP